MLNFFNFFSFLFLNGNNNANIIEPNVYETYFIIELGFIITYKKEWQFSSICPNIWIPNMENLQDQLSTFASMGDQRSIYQMAILQKSERQLEQFRSMNKDKAITYVKKMRVNQKFW